MRGRALLWALALLLVAHMAVALNDYWNKFCGQEDCYELLGIPEDANTTTIRTAYRKLSLHWHPDKNKAPEAKTKFQAIAKAYQVLMNETHRELYHHFQANPDDYWNEYGHVFYSKYAPKSDTVFVIVLLLVVFSIFGPVAQRSKYHHACSFLITAAIKNWSLREGGTKETQEIRRRALEQVRAKKGNDTGNGAPTGSGSGGGKKKDKEKKKMKEDEDPEFIQAVKDIVYAMEIKGGYRNWEWGDALAVKLALLPVNLGKTAWFNLKWWYDHTHCGKPLSPAEEEYLTRRLVGELRWEMLEEEGDREDLVAQQLWVPENREDFDFTEWREKREMSRMNPQQLKKFLKDRKRRQQMESEMDEDEDYE